MAVFTRLGTISKCNIGQPLAVWCLWEHNTDKLIKWFASFEECINHVYSDSITYHRPPTKGEIKFGYGATHYRDFEPIECVKKNGSLKAWFVSPDDGLRYYR